MKAATERVSIRRETLEAYRTLLIHARLALPLMPASKIVTLGELDRDPMAGRVMETKWLRDAISELDRIDADPSL